MKKALVLSGGGAKGAWSGGVIEYLIKEENKHWDIVVGTSTGSLLAPLSSINKIDELKIQYTSVNSSNIFSIKPFNKKGKLRILNAIWRILIGKESIGEAKKLRKRIEQVLTLDDFNKIKKLGKDVYVTVSNMTKNQVEYKSVNDNEYNDFCDWMFASASVPILFDIVDKDGCEYLDGGIFEPIPLQKAIDSGAEEIDVIILSSDKKATFPKMKNVFKVAMRTIDFMNKEINKDDIMIGKLNGEQMKLKINIYRTPIQLTDNSILFNKEQMNKWWKEGYEFAKDKNKVKEITLTRTKYNRIYKTR